MMEHDGSLDARQSAVPHGRLDGERGRRRALAKRAFLQRRAPGPPGVGMPDRVEGARPRRALVRVATGLSQGELMALRGVLERHFGAPLELKVEVDLTTLGGVWVRVGDTVIDGSLQGRLEALRRHLRVQCRVMVGDSMGPPAAGSARHE